MRHLAPDSDLADVPLPLRGEVAACLRRWRDCGVPLEPGEPVVALVEPGDTIEAVAALLGEAGDPDFTLPAEWVSDLGCLLEAYVCWTDAGNGVSILVPKGESTDAALLALCVSLATPSPTAP